MDSSISMLQELHSRTAVPKAVGNSSVIPRLRVRGVCCVLFAVRCSFCHDMRRVLASSVASRLCVKSVDDPSVNIDQGM